MKTLSHRFLNLSQVARISQSSIDFITSFLSTEQRKMTGSMKKRYFSIYKIEKYRERKLLDNLETLDKIKELNSRSEKLINARERDRKRYFEDQKLKI